MVHGLTKSLEHHSVHATFSFVNTQAHCVDYLEFHYLLSFACICGCVSYLLCVCLPLGMHVLLHCFACTESGISYYH